MKTMNRQPRPTTPDEEAEALYLTAIHESAHAVAAEQLFRGTTQIEITRHLNSEGFVWFAGRCFHTFVANDWDGRRTCSLAGGVAEALAWSVGRYLSDSALGSEIAARISAADAENAGTFFRANVDATIRKVQEWWPLIEARAQGEIAAFHGAKAPAPTSAAPPTKPTNQRPTANANDGAPLPLWMGDPRKTPHGMVAYYEFVKEPVPGVNYIYF